MAVRMRWVVCSDGEHGSGFVGVDRRAGGARAAGESLPVQVVAEFAEQFQDLVATEERVTHTDASESASTSRPRSRNDSGLLTSAFGNKASGPTYHRLDKTRAGSLAQPGTG